MRRAGAAKREVLPDPKYGSRLVAKFVNIMMIRGKKSTAERIMYDALAAVEDRSKQEALKMFKTAVDNVKPAVEVKSRRVGGSTYQVPVEVRPERRTSLAMRWMIGAARRRPERSMADKLAAELDRKSTRLNSSHSQISYAVFCLKKKKKNKNNT